MGKRAFPKNGVEGVKRQMRGERREVENRYGIRTGQTESYCVRCGKSWGFNHVCRDIYFQKLREEKTRGKALKNESNIDVGGNLTLPFMESPSCGL